MDKKKSARLLFMASIMMCVASLTLILLKIFGDTDVSSTLFILFFICAILFFSAAVNFKKSKDKEGK